MKISEALGERVDLAVAFPGGSVLNVVYTPSTYTVAELEELQSVERDATRVLASIRRLIVDWDLTDDSGAVIPLTEPTEGEDDPLRHVPTSIFARIFRAVNEDQGPGKADRA